MAKKSTSEMLGLGNEGTDTEKIREKKLISPQQTSQTALGLCWDYARHFGFTKADIASKYGLRSQSLKELERGGKLVRSGDRYVDVMIRALNTRRLYAMCCGNLLLAEEIRFALAEIALVRAGLATDHEMVTRLMENETGIWREKEVKKGLLKR